MSSIADAERATTEIHCREAADTDAWEARTALQTLRTIRADAADLRTRLVAATARAEHNETELDRVREQLAAAEHDHEDRLTWATTELEAATRLRDAARAEATALTMETTGLRRDLTATRQARDAAETRYTNLITAIAAGRHITADPEAPR